MANEGYFPWLHSLPFAVAVLGVEEGADKSTDTTRLPSFAFTHTLLLTILSPFWYKDRVFPLFRLSSSQVWHAATNTFGCIS